MSSSSPALPDEFFIFVNQASFQTQNNFALTGKFVSAAFGAANQDQVPVGTVALWSPGISAPRDEGDVRTTYQEGTLDYLQFDANPSYFGWLSPFSASISSDYRVEFDAEMGRRKYNPLLPSRLSAVYAFGDAQSCEMAHQKYGWPLSEVQRFRLLQHPLNRIVRVNMEIVSLAREAYRRGSWTGEQLDAIWRTYWFGGGSISVELPIDGVRFEPVDSAEIWEYLIEGVLERIG